MEIYGIASDWVILYLLSCCESIEYNTTGRKLYRDTLLLVQMYMHLLFLWIMLYRSRSKFSTMTPGKIVSNNVFVTIPQR